MWGVFCLIIWNVNGCKWNEKEELVSWECNGSFVDFKYF